MERQSTTWQTLWPALQQLQRAPFARPDQHAALLLFVLLVIGGEPLSCTLRCRFAAAPPVAAPTHTGHHAVFVNAQTAPDTHVLPTMVFTWTAEQHQSGGDAPSPGASGAQAHEHVAILFLMVALVVVGVLLRVYRHPTGDPAMILPISRRRPPILPGTTHLLPLT